MVERHTDNMEVEGPIPSTRTKCAISSVVERFIDIEKVGGSIPPSRTKLFLLTFINYLL